MSEEKDRVDGDETNPVEAKEEGVGAIDERKLLRKIDLHLLPGLALLLLLSFLDQGNSGLSYSFPLLTFDSLSSSWKCSHRRPGHRHTHECVLSLVFTPPQHTPHHNSKQAGDQFLTTLTAYFIGFTLFEVPCNIILKLTSPRFWLPTVTIAWGIICTLTGLSQNFGGFLTARIFLGMAESGYLPGIVFYLSMWYKRNEQLYRLALIIATVSLGGAFGGLFVSYPLLYLGRMLKMLQAFALAKMKGIAGLGGWRWIFIMVNLSA